MNVFSEPHSAKRIRPKGGAGAFSSVRWWMLSCILLLWCGGLNAQRNWEDASSFFFRFGSENLHDCVSQLADSADIWEEEVYYEGYASPLCVETCSSLQQAQYTFTCSTVSMEVSNQGAVYPGWIQWLAQMSGANVPEAKEALEAWVAEGRPSTFTYCLEMHGGYCIEADESTLRFIFMSAL